MKSYMDDLFNTNKISVEVDDRVFDLTQDEAAFIDSELLHLTRDYHLDGESRLRILKLQNEDCLHGDFVNKNSNVVVHAVGGNIYQLIRRVSKDLEMQFDVKAMGKMKGFRSNMRSVAL